MSTEPRITERSETPYVAITAHVTMASLGEIMPPLTDRVFGWLEANHIAPAGAPFWKYNVVDMERGLEIEAGVPIAEALRGADSVAGADTVAGAENVHAGVLPAGRYATLRHIGHPSTLIDATARLLGWAGDQGLALDVSPSADGERWGCRLEIYHGDPSRDMNEWETELAFRLAD